MSHQEDIELYQLIIEKKDQHAFKTLYRRYEKIIYSFCYKLSKDPQIAEEVIQEVFVKLWNPHSYYNQEKGKFSSWLLTLTRYTALDIIRKKQKQPVVSYEESDSNQIDTFTPEDHLQWKEKGMMLQDCMKLLKEQQQSIVDLFYFKGLSQQSIADRSGIPLGTVKGRIRLALKHLKSCLNGKGEIAND